MKAKKIGLFVCSLIGALVTMCRPAFAADQPTELIGGPDGSLSLAANGTEIISFKPLVADGNWKFYSPLAVKTAAEAPVRFVINVGKDGKDSVAGEVRVSLQNGEATAVYAFSSASNISYNALALDAGLGVGSVSGGTWETNGKDGKKNGVFPLVFKGQGILGAEVSSLRINLPDGRLIQFSFPQPVNVGIQDNRRWGSPTYTLRLGKFSGRLTAGEPFTMTMTVAVPNGLTYRRDNPVTLVADEQWVPLKSELDIVAGSALDFSQFGFTDGPCGSKGRVIVTPDGHFAFANDPKTPRRFYGVNLIYTANYLTKEQVDTLLDRLVRLGYNTIRIHHHEIDLNGRKTGFDWNPAKVDQLDYLMAGCGKRGIWITTDLYVSRMVAGKQVGQAGTGSMYPDKYKSLVLVSESCFEDFKIFTRKFLGRVNPYTGKTVGEDPTLAWLSLVNEGPATSLWGISRLQPEWITAWNKWLLTRYPDREKLKTALGDLAPNEDAGNGSVVLPSDVKGGTLRSRMAQVFIADTQKAFLDKVRRFLREELKCQALLTDMNNAGPGVVPLQAARTEYDYVDEHFYVDHPTFLGNPWQLPSSVANRNPIREGAPGASPVATVRLWGKPFTVSEYQYSGPGRYRGVGGILTGAMAGLQDWDVLWRFDYAKKAEHCFEPAPMAYFELANDPLNQAADHAAVLLFLRRDLQPAPGSVAVILPQATLKNPPGELSVGGMEWLTWITREGSAVVANEIQAPQGAVPIPLNIAADRTAVASLLRERGIKTGEDNDPIIRSGTGEIVIDKKRGVLTIDTPRSAGGYGDPQEEIVDSRAGVKVNGITTGATVIVNSLDANPIRTSNRLLVTHLTDLQNTDIHYAESARKTLLEWGGLPYLVREGSATVRITLNEPGAYTVWSLATNGRRLGKVEAKVEGRELVFTARVRSADGARMLYEVAR